MSSARIEEGFSIHLPEDVQERLGVKPGDFINFNFEGETIIVETLPPEDEVDLSEAIRDVREGRIDGPFHSAKELIEHLRE